MSVLERLNMSSLEGLVPQFLWTLLGILLLGKLYERILFHVLGSIITHLKCIDADWWFNLDLWAVAICITDWSHLSLLLLLR